MISNNGKAYSEEKRKEQIQFIRDNLHLNGSEIAGKLKLSLSYVWRLAKDNNLVYFSPYRRNNIKPKARQSQKSMDGFFDITEYSKSQPY